MLCQSTALCVCCVCLSGFVQVFLELVPRFLGMAPLVDDAEVQGEVNGVRERRRSSFGLMQRAEEYVLKQPRSEMLFDKQKERHGLTRSFGTNTPALRSTADAGPLAMHT